MTDRKKGKGKSKGKGKGNRRFPSGMTNRGDGYSQKGNGYWPRMGVPSRAMLWAMRAFHSAGPVM